MSNHKYINAVIFIVLLASIIGIVFTSKHLFINNPELVAKIFSSPKGITESQLNTLLNLGYTSKEITQLSEEEIAVIFAPGTHLDGMSMLDLTEEQFASLQKKGINSDEAIILRNLGYSYREIQGITEEELDFIFPNTQLIGKLVKKGYKESDVNNATSLKACGYGSYKQMIKEALSRKSII